MNPNKNSIDDYLSTTVKHQTAMTSSSTLQIKKKANDALSKITDSLFIHYKQSKNNPKRKKPIDYKRQYESLMTKNLHIKTSILNVNDNNKASIAHCHQKSQLEKSISHSKNPINESQSISSNTLNSNFISHNKNKSTVISIKNSNSNSNVSYSKDKCKANAKATTNIIGIGHELIRKSSKERNTNENKSMKLNQLLTMGNSNNGHKKNIIKNYLLNNYTTTTTTPNTINISLTNKHSDKSSIDNQKKADHHLHNTSIHTYKQSIISRSNSISNLDQTTTKTSTEATTTTSKRLSNTKKNSIQNTLKNKKDQNMSSLYLSHFSKPLQKKKGNRRNQTNQLNNSIFNQLHTINKTMASQLQHNDINTQLPQTTIVNHEDKSKLIIESDTITLTTTSNNKILTEPMFNEVIQPQRQRLNDTGSLSLLSEDSVFNYSKHRSSSGNNNNSLAYQNDSISFKRSSNKHSSNNNSNTIEKRSVSKDKLSSENNEIEPTVSYTYSDEEITGRSKLRKTRRNIQRAFNNEDFLTFYTEMNQKLFGYNK